VDGTCSSADLCGRSFVGLGLMLHPHSAPVTARPLLFGAAQSLRFHLAARLHCQVQPLISVAAFQPERKGAQSAQQLPHAIPSTVVSLEPVSTAVSNNVQVLSSGVRSVPRPPKGHAQRKKRKLRVAVDVDEGEARLIQPARSFTTQ
jgi:hypothetical protein